MTEPKRDLPERAAMWLAQLDASERSVRFLESENKTLREEIRRLRIRLNAADSRRCNSKGAIRRQKKVLLAVNTLRKAAIGIVEMDLGSELDQLNETNQRVVQNER